MNLPQSNSHSNELHDTSRVDQALEVIKSVYPDLWQRWDVEPSSCTPEIILDLERQAKKAKWDQDQAERTARQAERAQYEAAVAADAKTERERREAERLAAMLPLTDSEREEIETLIAEIMRLEPERASWHERLVFRGWNRDTLDRLRAQVEEKRLRRRQFLEYTSQLRQISKPSHEERATPSDFDEGAGYEARATLSDFDEGEAGD